MSIIDKITLFGKSMFVTDGITFFGKSFDLGKVSKYVAAKEEFEEAEEELDELLDELKYRNEILQFKNRSTISEKLVWQKEMNDLMKDLQKKIYYSEGKLRSKRSELKYLKILPNMIEKEIYNAMERGYDDTATFDDEKITEIRSEKEKWYNERRSAFIRYTTYQNISTCEEYRRFMTDMLRQDENDNSLSLKCKHFVSNRYDYAYDDDNDDYEHYYSDNNAFTDEYQLVTSWDKPSK